MFLLVSGNHVGAHPDGHQHTPYADMVDHPVVAVIAMPTSFSVPEGHQKTVKSSTGKYDYF